MSKFISSKFLIVDFYDRIRNEIDIYTEESIKKYQQIVLLEDNNKNIEPSGDSNKLEEDDENDHEFDAIGKMSQFDNEPDLKDEYNDKYQYNFKNDALDDRIMTRIAEDYFNSIRRKMLEAIKMVEEENLRYLEANGSRFTIDRGAVKMNEQKIETLRSELFAKKFCFLVLIEWAKSHFKLFTCIVDFYLNQRDIETLE